MVKIKKDHLAIGAALATGVVGAGIMFSKRHVEDIKDRVDEKIDEIDIATEDDGATAASEDHPDPRAKVMIVKPPPITNDEEEQQKEVEEETTKLMLGQIDMEENKPNATETSMQIVKPQEATIDEKGQTDCARESLKQLLDHV